MCVHYDHQEYQSNCEIILERPSPLRRSHRCAVNNADRRPAPPTLVRLEVLGDEVRVLFQRGAVARAVHAGDKDPPDQGDVLHPGILPQGRRPGVGDQFGVRRFGGDFEHRGLRGHVARAQHGPVDRVRREGFQELEVLAVGEVDGDTAGC